MRQLIFVASIIATIPFGPAAGQDVLGAARSGDASELAELLPEGANVEPDVLGRPLYFAAQKGHVDAVAVLLDRGADPEATFSYGAALHSAARGDYADVVALLLDRGADPDMRAGEFNNTALHEAAESGAIGAARLLLAAGADVNARNKEDQPPLHLAMRRDRVEVAALLRDSGAAPRAVAIPKPEEIEAAAADPDAAWLAARYCRGCHEMRPGDTSTATVPGPTLRGVFGRPKATVPGFSYSDAMLAKGKKWTMEELNQFIGDVYGTVPGTKMYNVDPNITQEERIAILALLASPDLQ